MRIIKRLRDLAHDFQSHFQRDFAAVELLAPFGKCDSRRVLHHQQGLPGEYPQFSPRVLGVVDDILGWMQHECGGNVRVVKPLHQREVGADIFKFLAIALD